MQSVSKMLIFQDHNLHHIISLTSTLETEEAGAASSLLVLLGKHLKQALIIQNHCSSKIPITLYKEACFNVCCEVLARVPQ